MVELALLAEDLGFDRFWVADQTFHADPFLLLHHLAGATAIPLGLAVTNPFTRHPVQIARAAATLSHLTPQRDWIVGLGAANPQHVLAPLGMEMGNSARQLAAALLCIRRLLVGETVSFAEDGVAFELHELGLNIEAAPTVKLFVGTRGPLTLREAGPDADGVIVEALFQPEMIRWAREQIADGHPEATDQTSVQEYVAWQVTEVLDDDQPPSDHVVDFSTMLMRSTARSMLEKLDFERSLIQSLRDGCEVEVPKKHVQQFVAAGTGEELKEMVGAAAGAGADAWSCVFTGDESEAAQSMKRFGIEVMEPLRRAELRTSRARKGHG